MKHTKLYVCPFDGLWTGYNWERVVDEVSPLSLHVRIRDWEDWCKRWKAASYATGNELPRVPPAIDKEAKEIALELKKTYPHITVLAWYSDIAEWRTVNLPDTWEVLP